ncbi:MAG: prepilin-type N-terminal cleavage/methylation domain-containing protein [Verrucomicrobiaceae bacterium]|nr:MAG: prepilin-type N-terminal cleavage/methylation domain-containing protein [Verrucomicrobiaceae bacterium]
MSSHNHTRRSSRAFTLIELLVVIAIIAILAAILFPVFAQAKEAAKKSVGVSHIKQMNLSCVMYSGDNDDVFPLANRARDDWSSMLWMLDVYPYTKNYDMFLNPQGAPHPTGNVDWKYIGGTYGTVPTAAIKNLPYYTVGNWPITNAMNLQGVRMGGIMGSFNFPAGDANYGRGCFGNCAWNAPSKSQTQLKDVANAALIFDAGEPTADFTTFAAGTELGTCVAGRESYNPGGTTITGATPRWNGGPKSCSGWRPAGGGSAGIPAEKAALIKKGQANIGFADGHVKSMGLPQLYRAEPCSTDGTVRCMVSFQAE